MYAEPPTDARVVRDRLERELIAAQERLARTHALIPMGYATLNRADELVRQLSAKPHELPLSLRRLGGAPVDEP